jgi:hypothetical protein
MYRGSHERNSMVQSRGLETDDVRRRNELWAYSSYSKKEEWSHILGCRGTRNWWDESMDRRFRDI